MKKIVSILMAAAMVVSMAFCLTSCGKDKDETSSNSDSQNTSVAQTLNAEFKSIVKANGNISAEEIAGKLQENDVFMKAEIAMMSMPVEEGLLNGFENAEIKGFKEGCMFGPMIGAQPFIGYVFRLDDGADVKAFMQTLKDNGNLRWNICTSADEMLCENEGNYVLFIMSVNSFEQDNADNGDNFGDFEDFPID